MKSAGVAGIVFLLAAAPRLASAHRIDEYLQATRIDVAPDGIDLELDLTPGIEIGPMVFALVNRDHDGAISAAEERAYAEQVLSELVLEIDGSRRDLILARSTFPTYDEMAVGTGTIRIAAHARGGIGAGSHVATFRNNHRPDVSVYLVNALVPANPRVRIGAQERDPLQRGSRLTFDVTPPSPSAGPRSWAVGPALVLCALAGYLAFAAPRGHSHK